MTRTQLIAALNRFAVTNDPKVKVQDATGNWISITKVELDGDSGVLLIDIQPQL